MAKYYGKYAPCSEPGCINEATETAGKRNNRGKGPRTLLCSDCYKVRMGYSVSKPTETKPAPEEKPEEVVQEIPQTLTRSDSFAAGHQKEVFYQQEIPGLGE
jgi:hypothetical protein